MTLLELSFASGDASLSVRHFTVEEGLSSLFRVSIVARSPDPDLDIDLFLNAAASFRIGDERHPLRPKARCWTGVCCAMEQLRAEPKGLSTYALTMVPWLWLLTQRTGNRLFQHLSIPAIVERLLGEWGIKPVWAIDPDAYPELELRVQYDESDYAFFCRLLEEAAITFFFVEDAEEGSTLVLHDSPQTLAPRPGPPIAFVDSPERSSPGPIEYVTAVRRSHEVRPGRVTLRDFDFRRPDLRLMAESSIATAARALPPALAPEDRYEQYHYRPGAFLVETPSGEGSAGRHKPRAASEPRETPVADDKGRARFEQPRGTALSQRILESRRASRQLIHFRSNVLDLGPGVIFSLSGHPRQDLEAMTRLLTVACSLQGEVDGEWLLRGSAVLAESPYRPPLCTPKPRIVGVQSALVVGPPGEEIYTDEFGRVRVQFPWDREGTFDDDSSMWMRVSQGFAGAGYGMFSVPRVGHEVLVGFLDGDVDAPIVVGRVHNGRAPVPYTLPEHKTVSTWKSSSTPGADGFNELRFEDRKGKEHVYLQAERDLVKLVKHDEMSAVGRDRSRLVQGHETVTVGRNRTKIVRQNEMAITGLNRAETVGLNRHAMIGVEDSTLVGGKFSVTMARGLSAELSERLSKLMDGPLGPLVEGPLSTVLGVLPQRPLGAATFLELAMGPLAELSRLAPEITQELVALLQSFPAGKGPLPTALEMVDRKITLTTGEASIVLEGPNIHLRANGDITLHAKGNSCLLSDQRATVMAQDAILLLSQSSDVIHQSAGKIRLNPYAAPAERLRPPSEEGHAIAEVDLAEADDDCKGHGPEGELSSFPPSESSAEAAWVQDEVERRAGIQVASAELKHLAAGFPEPNPQPGPPPERPVPDTDYGPCGRFRTLVREKNGSYRCVATGETPESGWGNALIDLLAGSLPGLPKMMRVVITRLSAIAPRIASRLKPNTVTVIAREVVEEAFEAELDEIGTLGEMNIQATLQRLASEHLRPAAWKTTSGKVVSFFIDESPKIVKELQIVRESVWDLLPSKRIPYHLGEETFFIVRADDLGLAGGRLTLGEMRRASEFFASEMGWLRTASGKHVYVLGNIDALPSLSELHRMGVFPSGESAVWIGHTHLSGNPPSWQDVFLPSLKKQIWRRNMVIPLKHNYVYRY